MTTPSRASHQDDRDAAVAAIEAHFDTLQIGARIAHATTYDDAAIAEYVARVGLEYPGRYARRDGETLVPPGMVFMGPARTFGLKDGPALARGGFFTAAKRTYRLPVCAGDELRFEGRLEDKFERGGYFYVLVSWTAYDAAGTEVARGTEEHTLGSVRKPRAA